MGLDQDLMLVQHYFHTSNGVDPTLVDGFPLKQRRLNVVTWRKHHWVHNFICSLHPEANECVEVHVETHELKMLADMLEKWVNDPNALPPINDNIRGPFFGARTTDDDYEMSRDCYREDATQEAKQIRKAVKWLENSVIKKGIGLSETVVQYRYAIYKSSW